MCGRCNVIDAPLVQDLLEILGIPVRVQSRLNIAPGSKSQIVYETNQGRSVKDTIWSLLIEPKPDGTGYRPSPKYSTFNARSGSLGTSPLWKKNGFTPSGQLSRPVDFTNGPGKRGASSATKFIPLIAQSRLPGFMNSGISRVISYLRLPSSHCRHIRISGTFIRKVFR